MPNYEFLNPKGEVVTRFYSADRAPEIGSVINIDGEPCTRIISTPRTSMENSFRHGYPRVSYTLPRGIEDAPCMPDGKPVITSKKHQDELCKKYKYTNDLDILGN